VSRLDAEVSDLDRAEQRLGVSYAESRRATPDTRTGLRTRRLTRAAKLARYVDVNTPTASNVINRRPDRTPTGSLPPVRDEDVRRAMTVAVSQRMAQRPHVLVPEVEVRWSVPARLDALLVADRISGFEIKSDVDSLSRLPRQVEAYGMVVERATLVVGERHRAAASALVPAWWNIWVARWRGDEVAIRQVRGGRLNPSIDSLAVTSFLSRDDLVEALRARGHSRLSSMSVDQLRLSVASELGRKETLKYARATMLARQDWRSRSLAAA
jgi:hypothetical protein